MKRKPVVAIVGRPNVGKSTFVNRLVGSRESIVDDMPGVTRDRIYFDIEWLGKHFTCIDTGGIVPGDEDEIMLSITAQAEIAAEEADAILFVVDGKDGINSVDEDIANILRRIDKKIFLVVNKIDDPAQEAAVSEFYSLGIGEPYPISALHGSGGVGDLLDAVSEEIPDYVPEDEDRPLNVAIVGKPNAGKSSLVNALIGKERVIVSDVAGTTRDTIDSEVKINGVPYTLLDTAGIRKKGKVDYGIEKFAVARAIKAIRECDVVVIVVDVTEGLTDQDKKIANIAEEAGRGIVLAMNKWDLIEDKDANTINKFTAKIREEAPFLNFVPMVFISALEKQRITKIFDVVSEVHEQCIKKLSTSILNKIVLESFALSPPVSEKGKRLKAYYSTQVGTKPPVFIIFVNDTKLIKASYLRYLEKKIREAFGFLGTPIKIMMRERKEKKSKK